MGNTEQHTLQEDRWDRTHATEEAAQHQTPKDELLDDRRCDHGRHQGRDQIGPVSIEIAGSVEIAAERDVEYQDHCSQHRLRHDGDDPRERTPSEIAPTELPPQRRQSAGAPPSAHVDTPRHRRPIGQHHRDRDVREQRPVVVDQRLDDDLADDQRHHQHDQRTERGRDRKVRMLLDLGDARLRESPGATVEVALPGTQRIWIPACRRCGGWWELAHGDHDYRAGQTNS